jgi:hypothetical protein
VGNLKPALTFIPGGEDPGPRSGSLFSLVGIIGLQDAGLFSGWGNLLLRRPAFVLTALDLFVVLLLPGYLFGSFFPAITVSCHYLPPRLKVSELRGTGSTGVPRIKPRKGFLSPAALTCRAKVRPLPAISPFAFGSGEQTKRVSC